MKKILYVLIAVLVLGGVAYALTQTSLLKGSFPGGDVTLRSDTDLTSIDTTDLKSKVLEHGMEIVTPSTTDTDGDSLPDDLEVALGTSWNLADTDGDGIDDGKELNKTNEYITDPTLADTDGGGVDDGTEIKTNRTNPLDATDDVEATAEEKVNFSVTGISYSANNDYFYVEVCAENTDDPNYSSTTVNNFKIEANGNSYEVGLGEVYEGCASLSIEKTATTDYAIDTTLAGDYEVTATIDSGDAHTESDETDNSLTETITFEGTAEEEPSDDDADDDGLTDTEEAQWNTDPNIQDSDDDGLSDGYEVYRETPVLDLDFTIQKSSSYAYKEVPTLPNVADTDLDGLLDGEEYYEKTNPLEIDTDLGGIDDFAEVEAGTDPLDESDDVVDSGAVDTYYCTDLTVDPETYTITGEDEDVEFDVEITLNGSGEPSISSTGWTGTLIIETEGSGTLYDSNGNAGIAATSSAGTELMVLKIDLTYADLTETITYKDGSEGDDIKAYITGEKCADTLSVTVDIEDTVEENQEETLACTSLDIVPDTYTLPSGETTVDFTVEVKANGDDSSWTSFIKNIFTSLLTFTVVEEDTVWDGMLIIKSDSEGDGSFSNNVNSETGNPIPVAIEGTSNTISVTYENALAGETITASIEDEEEVCTDTLTLDEEEVAVDEDEAASDEEIVADDEEVATDEEETVAEDTSSDEDDSEEVATTTTDDSSSDDSSSSSSSTSTSTTTTSSSDWDTILASKEYVCSEPFTDMDVEDWYWGKGCRLYNASVFTGTDEDTIAGGKYLTRAEAIKVLVLLSGNEDRGSSEHFTDVSPSDWFYDYYVAAEDMDIVRGTSANPNTPITRGDLMLYMTRIVAENTDGEEGTLWGWDENDIPFSDLSKTDYYTYSIIIGYNTIVEDPDTGTTRVFEGYSNGTSGAKNYIARSEAMTLALRFYLAWYAN